MKKIKITKAISAIMALLILASCSSAGAGEVSSALTENENQNTVISSAASEETSSEIASSDTQTSSDKKEEQSSSSKKPETQQSSSSKKPTTEQSSSSKQSSSKTPSSSSSKPDTVTSSQQTSSQETEKTDPKYIKYVMLEDNPAPVTVNREDAGVPTPISFTDTLQNGEAIAFETQTVDVYTPYSTRDRYISVINYYDELKAIYDAESEHFNEDDHYINLYNQEFFNDNAIIMLFIIDGTSDCKQKIEAVTQKDGQMCIHLKNTYIGEGYAMDYARIFIEVSKEDLKNINNIVVYEEKIAYKRGNETLYIEEFIYRDKVTYA